MLMKTINLSIPLAMSVHRSHTGSDNLETSFRKTPSKNSISNRETKKGFTLIELTLTLLIITILTAVAIPIMRGRIDSAKWTEANAKAGAIRRAVRAYVAEKTAAEAQSKLVGKTLGDSEVQSALGFSATDLAGTYFIPTDFTITRINDDGTAEITVTGSQNSAPNGTKVLGIDGSWK